MKRRLMSAAIVAPLLLTAGCSPSFWGGAAGGTVGTGAGYEWHLNRQMQQVEEEFKAGKIDQKEYDIRKEQIKRDSVLQ